MLWFRKVRARRAMTWLGLGLGLGSGLGLGLGLGLWLGLGLGLGLGIGLGPARDDLCGVVGTAARLAALHAPLLHGFLCHVEEEQGRARAALLLEPDRARGEHGISGSADRWDPKFEWRVGHVVRLSRVRGKPSMRYGPGVEEIASLKRSIVTWSG